MKTPAIVLGRGWAGTRFSIEKYGARFAERGLIAMVIDYRGWGMSDGFASLVGPDRLGGDDHRDEKRFIETNADVVVKRTRLLPLKQVEDYRNAISYLQGEPGVDARVKAVAVQVPGIAGQNTHPTPFRLEGKLLEDAIKRARRSLSQPIRGELTSGWPEA